MAGKLLNDSEIGYNFNGPFVSKSSFSQIKDHKWNPSGHLIEYNCQSRN